ncbi:hypothetical protein PVK06_030957 [Gossypium arboreum]|uniref:Serine/threonine-protein phosphatase 7 long form homolog n=1 Tax=Gossypium arboreum TaxID=29729 RepID=A0ABR0NPP8_GOSAR|nr:hypothetical protein PVK06_030957 [Gossypium arboreum]
MAEDQILQCHIRNLPIPPSLLIEPCLREVGFWHVALVVWGCKLDPKLVSVLVERWRPETYTFYFPCGLVLETINEGQIEMAWLQRNFVTLDEDSTKVKENDMLGHTSFRSSGLS